MWYSRMATRCARAILSSRSCEMITEEAEEHEQKDAAGQQEESERRIGQSGERRRTVSRSGLARESTQHRHGGQQPAYRVFDADVRAAHAEASTMTMRSTLSTVVTFNRRSIYPPSPGFGSLAAARDAAGVRT